MTIKDKLFKTIKGNFSDKDVAKFDTLLRAFASTPLFLKAHEEWECFLPIAIDVEFNPGSYKVTFEPLLKTPNVDEFSDFIMTYKKFTQARLDLLLCIFGWKGSPGRKNHD